MPTKLSRYGQSIFDICIENFGTLDNLIDLIRDNRISISGNLLTNTEIIVNNTNLGDNLIKEAIVSLSVQCNNKYESSSVITVDSTLITVDSTLITVDAT